MDIKEIQHFFDNIIIRLGYYDWKLHMVLDSTEGYCWHHKKTIDVGEKSSNPKNLILHEIAHIDTAKFCNNKHNISFWRMYEELVRKFLPETKPKARYNEDIGFYRMCYLKKKGEMKC